MKLKSFKKTNQMASFSGRINFNSVHFHYPGHENKPVLNNVSFSLKNKETLAIVGPQAQEKAVSLNYYWDCMKGMLDQ